MIPEEKGCIHFSPTLSADMAIQGDWNPESGQIRCDESHLGWRDSEAQLFMAQSCRIMVTKVFLC
jgi:hypothetical protein